MKYFVGLDASLASTSVCVIDEKGNLIREDQVESSPKAIAANLSKEKRRCARIGFESGFFSQWFYRELRQRKFPVVCIEARQARAILKTKFNKTDRNDAYGIAQIIRAGMYQVVHVKTIESQIIKATLASRRCIQSNIIKIEKVIRGIFHNFGLKIGSVGRKRFEDRVRNIAKDQSDVLNCVEAILYLRRSMIEKFNEIDKRVVEIANSDEICKILMTAPTIGPIIALMYRVVVDDPSRFKKSRNVGAHLGLTPRTYQSGALDSKGRITKEGDMWLRSAMVISANTLMRSNMKPSRLREWAFRVSARRGKMRAAVAVARRLAVILHRMWSDRIPYQEVA